jgi:periplasmic divalent cation tolerance protein
VSSKIPTAALEINEKMNTYIQISTTTGTKKQAQKIAKYLVEKKMAACVQISGTIESTYRWKGKVETASEYLCLIKTRTSLFKKVETAIKQLHPYETPEIIATPIVKGSREYLNWLDDETENLT